MKSFVVLLIVLFISSTSFGQKKKTETVVIQTEIFCDHCSECESCDQNIFMKLKEHNKGIRSVKIDALTNTITVKYKIGKTTVAEIEKAISMSGYKANELAADPEGYQNLDGCCKKK